MAPTFQKAVKTQQKLRLALVGPSGSGKTYTALAIGTALGGRIALIDTEHGSASLYADRFNFDSLELDSFAPENYIAAISAAAAAGYDVLIIDTISHAWAGKDGVLEFVDRQKASGGDGDPTGWRKGGKKQNEFVEAMLSSPLHLIATVRSKMSIIIEEDPKTHRSVVRKIGLQPIQREGIEYEFTLLGDLDQDHTLTISKSRVDVLPPNTVIDNPGEQIAGMLKTWLASGAPVPPPALRSPAPVEQKHATATNGHKAARPFAPDALKLALQKMAGIHDKRNETANDDQRATVAVVLETCFGGASASKDMRDSVALWLTDAKTIGEINGVMLLALLDWLKPVADSGGSLRPDSMAAVEALAVWDQVPLRTPKVEPDGDVPGIFDATAQGGGK